MKNFTLRYHRFQRRLTERKLDAFLISHPANLAYLYNFRGSAGLALFIDGESYLFVDARYLEEAEAESVNCRPVLCHRPSLDEAGHLLDGHPFRARKLGFEAQHLSYGSVLRIRRWKKRPRLVPCHQLIEELRMVKDDVEIRTLRKAFSIAQQALETVTRNLDPGLTELAVAGLIELAMRQKSADGPAFPTIVASGRATSRPHARSRPRRISLRQPLLIDLGVRLRGYCSDMTRVFLPDGRLKDLFQVVAEAQQAALQAVRPGVPARKVDEAARQVIVRAGYGDCFGHGTGHGLGLEVHELPRIAPGQDTVLEPGMVFTIEPGIYLPGKGGIRLEDAVVVTEKGYRRLSPVAAPDSLH